MGFIRHFALVPFCPNTKLTEPVKSDESERSPDERSDIREQT
jgi:hypothetical protein